MKSSLPLLVTLLFGCFLQAKELPEQANFHLYIAAGQSNMAGFAETLARDTEPHARIWLTRPDQEREGNWSGWKAETLVSPNDIGSMYGIGPWLSFAETMAAQDPDVTIGIINVAVGGTTLAQWMKRGDMTELALPVIRRAMEDGTLKGMIWHQGEAGTGIEGGDYARLFQEMIGYYRSTLGKPNLPIVAGTIGRMGVGGEVNEAVHRVAERDLQVRAAVSAHRTLKDVVHYDNESQRILGSRYADAMLTLQGRARPLTIRGPRQVNATAYQYLSAEYEVEGGDGSLPQWSHVGQLPRGIYQVGGWLSGILSATTGEYPFTMIVSQSGAREEMAATIEVRPAKFPLRLQPLLDYTATPSGRLENNHYLYASSSASVLMTYNLPSSISIGKATLSIYVDSVPDDAATLTLALAELPESLSQESGGVEVRRIIKPVETVRSGTWVEWDVTDLVKAIAPIENAIAFAIAAPDLPRHKSVMISSQRSDHPPILTLTP